MVDRTCQARKLNNRVSKDSLFSCLGVFDYHFVLQSEVSKSTSYVPDKVVMHTTVSIIAVNKLLFYNMSSVTNILEVRLCFSFNVLFLDAITVMIISKLSVVTHLLYKDWCIVKLIVLEVDVGLV